MHFWSHIIMKHNILTKSCNFKNPIRKVIIWLYILFQNCASLTYFSSLNIFTTKLNNQCAIVLFLKYILQTDDQINKIHRMNSVYQSKVFHTCKSNAHPTLFVFHTHQLSSLLSQAKMHISLFHHYCYP